MTPIRWTFAVAAVAVCAAASAVTPPRAAERTKLRIEPGPTAMTAEEKALEADPENGVRDAVILVEETFRDEDLGEDMATGYHFRAKILSNEARAVADIEIPMYADDGKLDTWWGRTILPDGTVLELPKSALERQSVAKAGRDEFIALKAALPGVVPGCVIDYGWVLRESGYLPFDRIELQRDWPIKSFRYEWKPYSQRPAAYKLSRTEGLDIKSQVEHQHIVVVGHDLAPPVVEPLMPPKPEVRAALVLYYLPIGTTFESYWGNMGVFLDRFVTYLTERKRTVKRVLQTLEIDAKKSSLDDALRKAYAWIDANVERSDLRSFEELQQVQRDDKSGKDPILDLLERRKGSAFSTDLLMITVARAFDARASLIFVADRTESLFDIGIRAMSQFDGTLVIVREKGSTIRDRPLILAPGSGLPYGEIPWWYSGGEGLEITEGGGRALTMPFADSASSVAKREGTVAFSDGNFSLVGKWTESGTGQVALAERRRLRKLSPEDRTKRIDRLCGAGPERDVLSAEVRNLDDPKAPLEVACEVEATDVPVDDTADVYLLHWSGPWIEEVPTLPEGERHNAVVFDYPRVERMHLAVAAPEGFVPGEAPDAVRLDTPFGRYELRITRTDSGFEVDRTLDLRLPVVRPDDYRLLRSFLDRVAEWDRSTLPFRHGEAG